MSLFASRREFLKNLSCSSMALPFVANLPSLFGHSRVDVPKRQRLIVMFTPNGTVEKLLARNRRKGF